MPFYVHEVHDVPLTMFMMFTMFIVVFPENPWKIGSEQAFK